RYKICIATNGLYEMQSSRLQEFLPHTHAFFVSETLGIIKPNRAFFTGMLTALQAKAEECLFIGDSLTSDVAGANTVGMDCVWFNPKAKQLPEGYTVKGQIEKIEDLQKYL
ncbi:MAG: HAD-IA family hydrolase, partial [Clostridia bacterium]|nr:HAD-IA family hydrolase [Clostridia bacterium]